jgi:hypothetical protein
MELTGVARGLFAFVSRRSMFMIRDGRYAMYCLITCEPKCRRTRGRGRTPIPMIFGSTR